MKSAPIYKTAAELGIEQWEHDGLVAFVRPLSRGALLIDMRCRTAPGIGGHVCLRARRFSRFSSEGFAGPRDYSRALRDLYWPPYEPKSGAWLCDGPQAASAIVNFLVTGDPQWEAVMAAERVQS